MVYSPVDFAAYSRATGQPYPETPEERAAMVDDVRRFREQQLKRDEGPGLLESAAMGAGILGGLIGARLAGKKLLAGRRKDSRTQSGRTPGKSGVQQVDLSVLQPAIDYVPPSKKPSTLVDVQETNEPFVRQQSTEAVDTGIDQESMRVSRTVQRDPGEDLAVFDQIQDQFEQSGASPVQAADAAAIATEGKVPFTQTDAPIQLGPISAQEMADMAREEMISRRLNIAATGLKPGTTQFERALAQSFRTSANIKPRMTGESMAKTTLPAGPIRQSVQGVSAVEAENLPELSVLNIGPEAVVTKTAMGTSIRGASPVLEQAPPVKRERPIFGTADINVPGAPDEYMADRPARETALSQIETQPQQRIDPYAIAQEEGGGSAGIGVYGIEPAYVPGAQSKTTGLMSAASERKPTDVKQRALDKVRDPFSQLSDEELGQISMLGTASEAYNASKQLAKRRSVDVSREILRLQKSGRPDAQQLVQQYIQELK